GFLALSVFIAAFFRDPIRTTPVGDGLIIAPADGLVTMITNVPPPRELQGEGMLAADPVVRVSIFMSVFDVHINRSPISGVIRKVHYIAGKFLSADLDKASEENERQHILVQGEDGSLVAFTQIAGLVARRIVPWIRAEDRVLAGQRIGLIRFGSRVDVYLPAGTSSQVLLGQSKFGAELDSLSDVVAFGVAPALITYLWILRAWNPAYGWIFALAYAVGMALRLARFNARIDVEDQPHKSAGFLTGAPAPMGAGIMLLPIMLWLASDGQWAWLRDGRIMAGWAALSAFLIVSSIATFSMGALRLKRDWRFVAVVIIAMIGVALVSAPWETLSGLVIVYLASIPFSIMRYAAVRRRRAHQAGVEPALPLSPPLPPAPPKVP